MNEQTDEHTKIGSRKINSKNLVKLTVKLKKLKNKILT